MILCTAWFLVPEEKSFDLQLHDVGLSEFVRSVNALNVIGIDAVVNGVEESAGLASILHGSCVDSLLSSQSDLWIIHRVIPKIPILRYWIISQVSKLVVGRCERCVGVDDLAWLGLNLGRLQSTELSEGLLLRLG